MRDFGILSPNPIFLHTILARLFSFLTRLSKSFLVS